MALKFVCSSFFLAKRSRDFIKVMNSSICYDSEHSYQKYYTFSSSASPSCMISSTFALELLTVIASTTKNNCLTTEQSLYITDASKSGEDLAI